MQSLYPYTPRKMPFEDLESTFVGREQLIDDLITNIREQSGKKALQHWMIIGTRGMGKSHIIAMIYHMVKQEKNLNTSWTPVLMNEEEQGIFSLHTLFIRIVTKLGEELIVENKQISEDITAFINSMRNGNHSKSDIIDYAVSYLKDYVKLSGKKLLVFMENADDVFERYIHKNNEIKQLRNILQQDNFMMLVATSPTFFGGISKNSAPLYDFFRIRRLDLLSFDEAVELLKRWAVLDERINKRKTAAFFDKDDYRLKVLFHLTGGNPRILLFLYMAVTGEEGISNAVDTFSTLLEEDLSNYYLNRMRDLSNQLQPIILALAESEFNLTQKEIARKSFLPMQSIGTAVVRLENDGLVKAVTEKKGKNTLYALTDQLFRLWHQWRTSVHDRHVIGAIVEFLAIWYKKRELLKMAECEDLTGVHCREALGFRATERFKGYWQAFHAESEELVQKYLKKKDYEAFFNTIDLLEETGYKTDDMAFGLINKIEENDGLNKLKIYFSGKIEEHPDEIEPYLGLAGTLFREEEYFEAEEVLKNAITLPSFERKDKKLIAVGWSFFGLARFKQENYAGAEEAFSRAIALNPKELNLYSSFAEVFIEAQRPGELIKNLEIMKDVTGLGEDTQAYIHFLMSLAFLFQKDQTPFLKNLKTAVKLADSLESQKKHLLLGELSDFLVELISRDRLETTKQFIGQLKNISQDIASVFNPLNHVIRYFEILFSDEKNVKMVEAKAQRLIDSITSEIKDPVKDMIERVKKNGSRGRPSLSK